MCRKDNQCSQTRNIKEADSHEESSPRRSKSVRPSIPRFAPIDRYSKAEWRRISGCGPWRHIATPSSQWTSTACSLPVSRRTHRKSLSHSIISWFGLSTFGQGTTREHETSSPNLNIMVSTRSSPSAGFPITTMPRPASSPDSASPSTPKEIPDRHSFGTSVHCPLCSMRIDRSEPTPNTFFPGFRSQTALRERSSILARS
jgi:hypothetical protein